MAATREPRKGGGGSEQDRLLTPAEVRKVLSVLERAYPDARCSLAHETPLQLLVATILSAQCTDKRVNQVTPGLFRKYGKAADYARAPAGDLEADIRSTGFFNNKARALRSACDLIHRRHGGEVPATMEELLDLPGVARKTANVVLGNAFGKAAGIVVDTHVARVAGRLGLTAESTPDRIEKDLMERVPRRDWVVFAHRLIEHGRRVCAARKPACEECTLNRQCRFYRNEQGARPPARPGGRRAKAGRSRASDGS